MRIFIYLLIRKVTNVSDHLIGWTTRQNYDNVSCECPAVHKIPYDTERIYGIYISCMSADQWEEIIYEHEKNATNYHLPTYIPCMVREERFRNSHTRSRKLYDEIIRSTRWSCYTKNWYSWENIVFIPMSNYYVCVRQFGQSPIYEKTNFGRNPTVISTEPLIVLGCTQRILRQWTRNILQVLQDFGTTPTIKEWGLFLRGQALQVPG